MVNYFEEFEKQFGYGKYKGKTTSSSSSSSWLSKIVDTVQSVPKKIASYLPESLQAPDWLGGTTQKIPETMLGISPIVKQQENIGKAFDFYEKNIYHNAPISMAFEDKTPEERMSIMSNTVMGMANPAKGAGMSFEKELAAQAKKFGSVKDFADDFFKGIDNISPEEKAVTETKLTDIWNKNAKQSPAQKIIDFLKPAYGKRAEQEQIYTATRGERLSKYEDVFKSKKGEEGALEAKQQLAGEMDKVTLEPARKSFNQNDLDSLFNNVNESKELIGFEHVTATEGLTKLLEGKVPTNGELKLLDRVFPSEFSKLLLEKQTPIQKVFKLGTDILNVPKSVMSSVDLSAPFRQGIFLSAGHPLRALKATKTMFETAFNEKAYGTLNSYIKELPTYKFMKEGKLSLTDVGEEMSSREELFRSNLAEKIPLLGKVIKGSNRAYSGFLNKLRADVFNDIYSKALKNNEATPKLAKELSSWVNTASGRGDLPKMLENASELLNTTFFSPKLIMSRLNILNPATYLNPNTSSVVRKDALRTLFAYSTSIVSLLGLAKMSGAEVSADMRSADFGKIKVGDKRFDITGGLAQYIRVAYQAISGEYVNSTTGEVVKLGEGYKTKNRLDVLSNLAQGKEAPLVSFITGLISGKSFSGDKFQIIPEMIDRMLPMMTQDIYDLYRDGGVEDIPWVVPALFGVGLQTYGKQIPYTEKTPTGKESKEKWRGQPGVGESIEDAVRNWIAPGSSKLSNIPENKWESLRRTKLKETSEKIKKEKTKTSSQGSSKSNYKTDYRIPVKSSAEYDAMFK